MCFWVFRRANTRENVEELLKDNPEVSEVSERNEAGEVTRLRLRCDPCETIVPNLADMNMHLISKELVRKKDTFGNRNVLFLPIGKQHKQLKGGKESEEDSDDEEDQGEETKAGWGGPMSSSLPYVNFDALPPGIVKREKTGKVQRYYCGTCEKNLKSQ